MEDKYPSIRIAAADLIIIWRGVASRCSLRWGAGAWSMEHPGARIHVISAKISENLEVSESFAEVAYRGGARNFQRGYQNFSRHLGGIFMTKFCDVLLLLKNFNLSN